MGMCKMDTMKSGLRVRALAMGTHAVACPGDGCVPGNDMADGKREE